MDHDHTFHRTSLLSINPIALITSGTLKGLTRIARKREDALVAMPSAASITEGGVCKGEADALAIVLV